MLRCYVHSDAEAVGLCKSCFKALCGGCAVDVGGGLACREVCEDEVKGMTDLVRFNVANYPKILQATSQTYRRHSIYCGMASTVSLLGGTAAWLIGDSFFAFLGPILALLLGYAAMTSYSASRKFAPDGIRGLEGGDEKKRLR